MRLIVRHIMCYKANIRKGHFVGKREGGKRTGSVY